MQYRQNFKNCGSNCTIQAGACFNDFSKSIVATGVKTFSMYDRAICTLNWKVWSYAGHPRRDIKFGIYKNFKIVLTCMGDPPSLGVADGLGNFKLLVRTLHTCAHQPCKNEGLTFNSRSKLNCQNWVQYRQNFKNYGSNCPIQGGACFNDFSKSIAATGEHFSRCMPVWRSYMHT